MGNVWGTANPLAVAVAYAAGSDTSSGTGAPAAVINTGAIFVPYAGNFYPIISGNIAVLCGATPPTALAVGFQIGAGATVDSQTVPPALLVANATLNLPVALVGTSSGTAWAGAGSNIVITLLATTQAVTFKFAGSRVLIAFFRGPDA